MLPSGSSNVPAGAITMRTDAFLATTGRLTFEERRALRDLALEVRVLPRRFTPLFVSVGVDTHEVATALSCGCPEASVLEFSGGVPFTTTWNTSIGMSCVPPDRILDHLYAQPDMIVGPESSEQPFGLGTLAVLMGQLVAGGYLVLICHDKTEKSFGEALALIKRAPLEELPSVGQLYIFRKPGGIGREQPFVSFLTRTYLRPRQLALNIASIKAQTDQSYEHIIIPDDIGVGLHAANGAFLKVKDRIRGQYVMILDDDDILITPGFVSKMKHIATFEGHPNMIVFKVWRLTEVVPTPQWWGVNKHDEEHSGHRVCNCYCVSHDLFMKTIKAFHQPVAGDQAWQKAMFAEHPTIFWWNCIVSTNTRIGRCEPEGEPLIWQQH